MIKLGNFTFDIDDYPSSIQMGGTSKVSISKFIGGHKSIQMLGNFLDTIKLKGTFRFNGAVDKMDQINDLWFGHSPLLLTVPGFSPRYVIITSFKPVYYNDIQIDYEIELEPVDSDNVDAIIYAPPSVNSSSSTTSSTTSSSSSSSVPTVHPQKTYIVKSGDTLWGIASKYYGNGALYTKIVSANNIKNSSLIFPGQKLIIP